MSKKQQKIENNKVSIIRLLFIILFKLILTIIYVNLTLIHSYVLTYFIHVNRYLLQYLLLSKIISHFYLPSKAKNVIFLNI